MNCVTGINAKGKEKLDSDVDLLISVDVRGLKFYGLVERLRNELHKNIELLQVNQLANNEEFVKDEDVQDIAMFNLIQISENGMQTKSWTY